MNTKIKLYNLLKKRVLRLDGAMGTQLQKLGMPLGVCPEQWCLDNPRILQEVHKKYEMAGSDIVYTSTFGANSVKLSEYGISGAKKINKNLAALAKRSVAKATFVAGDIGPTGKFIEPFGEIKFEDAVNIFKEQALGLLEGGVDLFVIETIMNIQEARAALIAVKEISDKFTMVSMTYEKDGRTLGGTDALSALATLQSLGADAVGFNCSVGPQDMLNFMEQVKPYAKVFLFAKPNAGVPRLAGNETVFDLKEEEFSNYAFKLIKAGANMVGGCCGTSPAYISKLKQRVKNVKPVPPFKNPVPVVSSYSRCVILDKAQAMCVIGESINPTGKKELADQFKQGKFDLAKKLAKEQEAAGAQLIDVNAGAAGADETSLMQRLVCELTLATNLPLVIDSTKPQAVERALRLYPGRAVFNSVSAEKGRMKKLIAIVKKYGAMFVLLPISEKGVPKLFNERKKNIELAMRVAERWGFVKDDIIVDCLAMAVSSSQELALETLKTIEWVSAKLSCRTILGLSNISFGLPKRPVLNGAFLSLAYGRGLCMVILNPLQPELLSIKGACDVLLNKDKGARRFISRFTKKEEPAKKYSDKEPGVDEQLFNAVIDGDKGVISDLLGKVLNLKEPQVILDTILLPAITKAGELYEKKEYFLPQLIASAEAMKEAVSYLEPLIKKDKQAPVKKTILLATVKGDIHDIGKNIVALLLKNHGFNVIDLGKDVAASKIIGEAKKQQASIVGLSALMTTTMVNMKEVVDLAKKEGFDCRFIVGGAVLNNSYAKSMGALYAKDGLEAIKIIDKIVEEEKL